MLVWRWASELILGDHAAGGPGGHGLSISISPDEHERYLPRLLIVFLFMQFDTHTLYAFCIFLYLNWHLAWSLDS